jgi:hypothetical protein
VVGGNYRVVVERPIEPTALDLDRADAEIQRRWFVWTAAGLAVHPVTWTDHDAGRPAAPVGRSDVTTPRSLGLRVSRPNAHADIILYADGWTDIAVRRPDAGTVIHETAQLESVDGFGSLLDRVVELITWSGIGRELSRPAPTRLPGAMSLDGGIFGGPPSGGQLAEFGGAD